MKSDELRTEFEAATARVVEARAQEQEAGAAAEAALVEIADAGADKRAGLVAAYLKATAERDAFAGVVTILQGRADQAEINLGEALVEEAQAVAEAARAKRVELVKAADEAARALAHARNYRPSRREGALGSARDAELDALTTPELRAAHLAKLAGDEAAKREIASGAETSARDANSALAEARTALEEVRARISPPTPAPAVPVGPVLRGPVATAAS